MKQLRTVILMQNEESLRNNVQYWIDYYKEQGFEADWCQSNNFYLVYELETNIILKNINFPIEEIPKQLIHG